MAILKAKQGLSALVANLNEKLTANVITDEVGTSAYSLSLEADSPAYMELEKAVNTVETDLENAVNANPEFIANLGLDYSNEDDKKLIASAVEYAAESAIFNAAPPSVKSVMPGNPSESANSINIGDINPHNVSITLESFDERDISNLKEYTVIANLFQTLGTKFSRAVAPTYTHSPSQSGISLVINMMYVQDDVRDDITGILTKWNRKSLSKAVVDSSILSGDPTTLVPVFRAGTNDQFFADPAVITPVQVDKKGVKFSTVPLKPGVRVNFKGICQTDEAVAMGKTNHDDVIEPGTRLKYIWLDIDGDIFKLDVSAEISSLFDASQQKSTTGTNLNFDSNGIGLDFSSQTIGAAAPANGLAKLSAGTNKYTLSLDLSLSGRLDLQDGDLLVNLGSAAVSSISDAAGNNLDLAAGDPAAVVTAVGKTKLIGYELAKAKMTNLNLRQTGIEIVTTEFAMNYINQISAPITIHRPPANLSAWRDTSRDLAALLNTVKVMTDNKVVDGIFEKAVSLAPYANKPFNKNATDPISFGASALFATPTYLTDIIPVNNILNNVASSNKYKDIAHVIADNLRILALTLWKESSLSAAIEALPPQYSRKATCVIACDPKVASILGSTLTPDVNFDFNVAASPNEKMDGKCFIFFRFDNAETPHPLNTFCIQQAPSLVFKNNRTEGNSTTNQTVVFSRVDVLCTSSIMASVSVTNIDAAFKSRTPLPQ